MKSAEYWLEEMGNEKAKLEKELIDLEYAERQRREGFKEKQRDIKDLIGKYQELIDAIGCVDEDRR